MASFFIGLFLLGAGAEGITIPPISECAAEDSARVEFRGHYQGTDPVRCWLFERAAEEGCDKGLKAANHALEKCQTQGKPPCRISRCWENPQ